MGETIWFNRRLPQPCSPSRCSLCSRMLRCHLLHLFLWIHHWQLILPWLSIPTYLILGWAWFLLSFYQMVRFWFLETHLLHCQEFLVQNHLVRIDWRFAVNFSVETVPVGRASAAMLTPRMFPWLKSLIILWQSAWITLKADAPGRNASTFTHLPTCRPNSGQLITRWTIPLLPTQWPCRLVHFSWYQRGQPLTRSMVPLQSLTPVFSTANRLWLTCRFRSRLSSRQCPWCTVLHLPPCLQQHHLPATFPTFQQLQAISWNIEQQSYRVSESLNKKLHVAFLHMFSYVQHNNKHGAVNILKHKYLLTNSSFKNLWRCWSK